MRSFAPQRQRTPRQRVAIQQLHRAVFGQHRQRAAAAAAARGGCCHMVDGGEGLAGAMGGLFQQQYTHKRVE